MLGLALGSGGARGWCHIGVLEELESLGVRPEVIAGCSMGALVGAAYAAGCLAPLKEWALELTQRKFLTYVDLDVFGGGLVRGAAIQDILTDIGLPERLEDLDIPFTAVACGLATGQEVIFKDGPLWDAIRGSISIPGVFSPHQCGDAWLLDGGLLNPVPVSCSQAMGADTVIAVNPNAKLGLLWTARETRTWADRLGQETIPDTVPRVVRDWLTAEPEPDGPSLPTVLNTSIDVVTEAIRQARRQTSAADIELDADLAHIAVMEFFRAEEAIDEGRRLVREAADQITAACA